VKIKIHNNNINNNNNNNNEEVPTPLQHEAIRVYRGEEINKFSITAPDGSES
jgi:hypothetical protein